MPSPNILTRREWIAASATLLAPLAASAKFSQPVGVQLYTVRNVLLKEPDRILKSIADIGYKEVEGNRADLVTLQAKLKQYGLKPVSCHGERELITGNWGKATPTEGLTLESAIHSAKEVGVRYFVMPYLPPDQRGDTESYKVLADKMNHAGDLCKHAGLEFAYHNHAFEFDKKGGERPIDIFKARLDPKLVALELDVFWVSVAGQDPLAMLSEWKGRVSLLHLKDKAKDTPVQYTESVQRTAFQEVGSGMLDFPAIVKAARAAGVKHFFVEQDQTPGDPLVSLKKSFDYINTLS